MHPIWSIFHKYQIRIKFVKDSKIIRTWYELGTNVVRTWYGRDIGWKQGKWMEGAIGLKVAYKVRGRDIEEKTIV
jgi:hypothetical protein